MNPFDEQEEKLLSDMHTRYSEMKLKRLYTWHDMEVQKNKLEDEKEKWHWPEFWAGSAIAFILTTILFIISHNI